jgi:ankyrin repeat protein
MKYLKKTSKKQKEKTIMFVAKGYIKDKQTKSLETLLKDNVGKSELDISILTTYALESKNLDALPLLVNHGADPHYNNEFALRWASTNGENDTVNYLLKLGAKPSANKFAPIRWAHDSKQIETTKLLLKACSLQDLKELLEITKEATKPISFSPHKSTDTNAVPNLSNLVKKEINKKLLENLPKLDRTLSI